MSEMTLSSPEQLSFNVQGLTFKAQAWGHPEGIPVLAVHGWLDSSASYFRLAPLLEQCYVVAVDCAGHGRSDHRLGQEPYNIWQDIGELFAIADALGWDRFALIGHSRGAIISTLAAGTFPERITHLALLDGMLPQPIAADQAPQQLAQSIKDSQRQRRLSVYDDLEPMIQARMHGLWSLSRVAASALIERGVKETAEGAYQWSSDPMLKAASSMKLTLEQAEAFVERIEAPVKLLLAQGGTVARYPEQVKALDVFHPETLAGTHHFHMEEQAVQIAERLSAFLV